MQYRERLIVDPELLDPFYGFDYIQAEKTERDAFSKHGDQQQFIVNFGKMELL